MANPSPSTKRHRLNEKGAFAQVVPPSALASPPSSSTQSKLRWNVFISHRGPDVKATLATAIYNKLSSMEEQVFLDERALKPGDSIPAEIQKAMNDAFLHVAIFSKGYADSPWCLAELSHMLRTNVKIIPIFYYVDPSDLHWVDKGKGLYAGSFAKHESKGRYTEKKLGEWKEALQKVSYKSGYELKNDDWGWVLEGLANSLEMERSKGKVAVPTHALGLEERLGEIEEIIQGGEKVHIVGIVGMGGCGKTTLAKGLFNRKLSSFSKRSFLYDVRDRASKNQLSGLQKKLLEDLHVTYLPFESVEEGKDRLAEHLRSLRALVVLDDVDRREQIDSLLTGEDMLASGSIVIITTRCKEVLTSWRISKSSIYEMKGLSKCHARELFCSYAFQTSGAPGGFEDLVERALESCRGLPLSLKVFGGQLCFKPRDYWESQLNEISRVLPEGILRSLKISYDALDQEEQELFLDVACFFIGENKSLAVQLWDGPRRSGVYSWETLQNKCLVELDEDDRIRMHDHLRDLGREIADKKLPYRIWYENQINSIQAEAKERMQVRGIMAAATYFYDWILPFDVSPRCTSHYPPPFKECMEVMRSSNTKDAFSLKYLIFNNKHVNPKIGELSRGLVWLRCFNFNHANLSSCLSLRSLRVLELYDVERLETIWENEGDAPLQLRELIIHSSDRKFNFQGFPPSIGSLTYLKKIVIRYACSSITSLPNEFCNLKSLEYLELQHFEELSSLPISFGDLRNLSYLRLSHCSRINTLPKSFGTLFSLKKLSIDRCKNFRSLPDTFGNLFSLKNLMFRGCDNLISLPDTFGDLSSLIEFTIFCCLKSLPANFGRLNALEELEILFSGVESLPETFGQLANLRRLEISDSRVESLPETFGQLANLRRLEISDSRVESLPETFGQLANLRTLGISHCPIRELAFGSGSKASLNNLREIKLEGTHLSTISISEDCCPSLETLDVWNNKYLKGIETLPKTLKWVHFPIVDALPSFAHLTGLKELQFSVSHKVEKVEGLEYLRSLETLIAHSEWEVPGIQSLEHLERLKTLELSANNFGALEPCIQTIKEWPAEIRVWARVRAMDGVESIVKDFPVGKVGIKDSFTEEADEWTLAPPQMQSSDAAIVCFVIQRPEHPYGWLCREGGVNWVSIYERRRGSTWHVPLRGWYEYDSREAKRWVWISVCDFSTIANEYHIDKKHLYSGTIIRGKLVVGEKKCVIGAFKKLLCSF